MTALTLRILAVLDAVPPGKVATYGQIAVLAGNPRAARQVVRILSSKSRSGELKWHRIVRRDGGIALPPGGGFELQKSMLHAEGIEVDSRGVVDLSRYQWQGVQLPPA